MAENQASALVAAEVAVDAIKNIPELLRHSLEELLLLVLR